MDPSAPAPLRRLAALPLWRALACLGTALILVLLVRSLPGLGTWPLAGWSLLVGTLAVLLGWRAGLSRGWRAFLLLTPLALAWQLGAAVPSWIYMGLLGALGLVFGGGILTRVPLYNSNRAAWRVLSELLPGPAGTFVDLGAGLGGPLAHLARTRPGWTLRGVEASPLVWVVAWLRCRGCRIRLGSLWHEPLGDVDVAYAFLSPAPMADLWAKVRREMRPGTLLVSHSFEVPGVEPERTLPLPGRPGACLRLYRLP